MRKEFYKIIRIQRKNYFINRYYYIVYKKLIDKKPIKLGVYKNRSSASNVVSEDRYKTQISTIKGEYPRIEEVTAKFRYKYIFAVTIIAITLAGGYLFQLGNQNFSYSKILSILGLIIDMYGIVITFSHVEYFGSFLDAGALESLRIKSKQKVLNIGLIVILIGFTIQAIASLVP